MEGVERSKVNLLPHSQVWDEEFLSAKRQLETLWRNNVLDIQHVGSTAISSICAKPILDIAVRLKSIEAMDLKTMEQAGYEYCGARHGKDSYHLFVLRDENDFSLRHIHCYAPDEKEFFEQVGFRDYLNTHPEEAKQYENLKKALAAQYAEERFSYTAGKDSFIKNIISRLQI